MRRAAWLAVLMVCLASGCPLPDMGGEGQDCFEPPDECNGGLVCSDGTCVEPECTQHWDCPDGQYCEQEVFECREGCGNSDQCDSGYYCDLMTHECTRDPDAPAELGEPCQFITEFGTVHPEANNCLPDLRCIGYPTEGSVGYCPGQSDQECWMVRDVYNRDCVDGICSGSFCCALCSAGSCPTGYDPLELQSGECVCIPLPANEGCHPLEQDCPSGKKCIPSSGLDTRCIPIGYVEPGGSCNATDNLLCQTGYMCLGSNDVFDCDKLCDQNDSSTCEPGYTCAPINNVDRWGYCRPDA